MQTILITGARSGIIYPVINKLKNKYKMYVTVHTKSEEKYVKKLYQNIPNIKCLKLDVTKDIEKLNNLDIDILICNAAIAESGAISEININKVKDNFEVNVFSNLKIIQKVIAKMINKKTGKIIVMSSLAGKVTIPFLGSYCSSKAALSQIIKALYYENKLLKNNIKIVLIEPGLYKTGFNKLAFDKKYDNMENSYFKNKINLIQKCENIALRLFEKKNLYSIDKKIIKAITSKSPKFRYSSPLVQNIFAKIYNLFN